MKKALQFIAVLAFVFGLFSTLTPVLADGHEDGEAPTDRKVVVHYHRWDGDYDGRNVWTWNTGTNGSQAPVALEGTDEFGGYFEIYVDEDAGDTIGLILRYGDAWGNGQNDRDGLIPATGGDKANKEIIVKQDGEFVGFDENGVKHVFVYEGMNEVIYQDEVHGPMRDGYGTLAIVYYDPAESYEGWNLWTWDTGTGGSAPANDTGVPFQAALDVDGGTVGEEMYRIAFFSIGEDAADEIGFIVRTDAWDKQWEEDLFVDVTDLKGSGFRNLFYIGLAPDFYDTFEEFDAIANAFEVETGQLEDTKSLLLNFNKPVQVAEEVDSVLNDVFDASWFSVVDSAGNEVAINNISYEKGVESVAEFMLIFEDELDRNETYTMTYLKNEGDLPAEFDFSVPSEAPTITIIGATDVELELGDRYSLPTFRATENFYGENLPLYNARVKEGAGYLSTREAGEYEIVLEAHDRFGNVAEETITVTVVDPCADTATASETILPITLFAGLPLLAGAYIALRRKEDQ